MDVFSLREELIGDYSRFARSFTTILAEDLRRGVDEAYSSGRYWPDPLIQINPRYKLVVPQFEIGPSRNQKPRTWRGFD